MLDVDIAATQIKELVDVLAECDAALEVALGADIYDHKITQQLLDVRIRIWETTNK